MEYKGFKWYNKHKNLEFDYRVHIYEEWKSYDSSKLDNFSVVLVDCHF